MDLGHQYSGKTIVEDVDDGSSGEINVDWKARYEMLEEEYRKEVTKKLLTGRGEQSTTRRDDIITEVSPQLFVTEGEVSPVIQWLIFILFLLGTGGALILVIFGQL